MSDARLTLEQCGPETVQCKKLLQGLKVRYEAAQYLRRGICLLNAGQYQEAGVAFAEALEHGCSDEALPSYLAACLLGQHKPDEATEHLADAVERSDNSPAPLVRHALAVWAAGKYEEAIGVLREGVQADPECAELHFQLGLLLASLERYEEAELRFTQVLNINHDHTEAAVNLALCCGARNAPAEALSHLQRAQTANPHDARIGLLLAQSARAVQHQGLSVRLRAGMPDGEHMEDARGIEELSRVIEAEPDFVDAFLSIPVGQVDERIFAMLLETLEGALERQPEHAELHYHCGRVMARLGRREDAITENERAVGIAPTFIRALIELGKLYQQTDRDADATTRLEQAVAAGAEYADVYYLLGNLYRDKGQITRARTAYRHALVLNCKYEAAIQALEALPVA